MALENLTKITSVGISSHIALTGVTTVGFITSADAWVGGALTVGGNITIGGTVTYEDVTNIDSVGIITSQNGLRVTAGGINVTAGVSTYSGLVDVNNRIDVVGGANIDQANITGIVTAGNAIILSEDNAIHFRGVTDSDRDAILRASAGGGQLLINSRNDTILNIDSNGDGTDAHFAVAHGAATGSSTELFRVQENGRVGINTTSLAHVLHTQGSGNNGSVRFENSHSTTTVSGNTASTAFSHNLVLSNYQGSGNADNRMASIGFDIPTTSSHANATIAFQATNSSGNGDLQFWLEDDNTSRERLRITSDGNVGIGTTLPSQELTIHADTFAGLLIKSNRTTATDQIGGLQFMNQAVGVTTATINALVNGTMLFKTAGSERLRITSAGKLIASTNTSTTASFDYFGLHFTSNNSTVAEGLFINNIDNSTGDNASISFSCDSGNRKKSAISHVDTGSYGRGDLVFSIDPDADSGELNIVTHEKLRITSAGKVGIGTDVPDTILHLSDSSADTKKLLTFNCGDNKRNNYIGINGNDNLEIGVDEDEEGGSSSLRLRVDGSEVIRLEGGMTGIRHTDPKATLHVKAHDNNWEAGLLLEDNTGDDGWNLHPESSGSGSLMIGYNDDTTLALASQSATTVVKLHSGGNLEISNGDLKVASGHGVDFTAAASGNATSGQTILDDYEQGTFTPLMYGHSTGTGSDTISGNGYYTKVGNVVTTVLVFSNKNGNDLPSGGSEQFRISGLPFNAHANGGNQNTANIFTYNVNFDPAQSQVFICAGDNNYLRGYRNRDTATWQPWYVSDWRQSQIYLYLSLTYLSTV